MRELFHKITKEGFLDTVVRKRFYTGLASIQADLDEWLGYYNCERPHSGEYCYGKTPMKTFEDSKSLALWKNNELPHIKGTTDKPYLTDMQPS